MIRAPEHLNAISVALGAGFAMTGLWVARWATLARSAERGPGMGLRRSAVLAIWLLSALAMTKETAPLGLGRWETACSLFAECRPS